MMKDLIPTERIERVIFLIRGQKVILDADLALIYGVPTKGLNQAVKRNLRRFPSDFVFRLTAEELEAIQSQIAAGSQKHRDPRFLPYAFTEHGAIMAANVLNSHRAVQMSVFVVRAFVKMRGVFVDTRDLANLTLVIESDTLKRARMRALEEGTSVNAVVQDYLADYAGTKAQKEKAINDLLRLSQRAKARRGNRRWTREDLHQSRKTGQALGGRRVPDTNSAQISPFVLHERQRREDGAL